MSSKESLNNSLNQQVAQSLQIVLPVIYIIVALLGLFGNLIVLQIICANRFRHKSIHLLISSLAMADFFFIIIFTIVRSVSYGYLHVNWFINVNDWCKAEMYLLRLFEFVLAYTVVFLCLDRAVSMGSCWFGVRKFRSGISDSRSLTKPKIDTNKHGIRRETSLSPKPTRKPSRKKP